MRREEASEETRREEASKAMRREEASVMMRSEGLQRTQREKRGGRRRLQR